MNSTAHQMGPPPAQRDEPVIPWYRLPILWLGALIFGASVTGCALLILLGSRHADEPLPEAGITLLKMPLGSPAPSRDSPRDAP
ncbi:MAG: hypothetical protein IRZ28_10510 [Steroidobacteraceae bacterium]|nr:hypothetical protein [Steroidobacteraceae bacterium]